MSKLRSVSTGFWSDPFVEELTPSQKLLFLYLITNEKTNMLGIYEVSTRKMSFETGMKKDEIEKALKTFEKLRKVKYTGNYVILVNYMKHQNFNTNMKKSAIDIYNELPKELKEKKLIVSKTNPIESFESLLNHYGILPKVEVEDEEEDEEEKPEPKKIIPTLSIFLDYIKEVKPEKYLAIQNAAGLKWQSWKANDWKDGNDKKITNWKTKILNTIPYLKEEEVQKRGGFGVL